MISQKNLHQLASESKLIINNFVEWFISYIYWEEWNDRYWIWDVWSTVAVWDLFLWLDDMFIYMKYKPDEIFDIYRDYIEVSDKCSLEKFIKDRDWEKEEVLEKASQYDTYCSLEEMAAKIILAKLQDEWVMVAQYIQSLHTWEVLHSSYEWEFVEDSKWKCFIDQTLYYMRIWWEEWVDYIKLYPPISDCIFRWSYWKSWKDKLVKKRISDLNTDHIEKILETQEFSKRPTLKTIFKNELDSRWSN